MAIVGEAEVVTPGELSGQPPGRIAGPPSRKLYTQLRELSETTGALIVEQLHHPGGQVWFEERRRAFAPSAYPQPRSYTVPLELTISEIRAIQASFLVAASCVWEAGLGGVEVKADQGKLLHQFLSREFNRRQDSYGGNYEGRSRMLREVLWLIRSRAPPGFLIGIRLSGNVTPAEPPQYAAMSRELSITETVELCRQLEREALVDYFSVSGESNSTVWGYLRSHGDETVPELTFQEVSRAIKQHVELPVLLAGRILDLNQADRAISSGACDAVGMARALIADGELLARFSGRTSVPNRPCLSCNISCVGHTWYNEPVACVYDPVAGREKEISLRRPTLKNLRLAVVGAGPAGLEFARAAGQLGSKVSIFERRTEIGGRLNLWKLLPGRARFQLAIDYWRTCIKDSPNVSVELGVDFKIDANKSEFDYLIVATGAQEVLPSFVQSTKVANLTPAAAISRLDWLGAVAVVVDADRYSDPLGIAVLLAQRGARVRVVTPFDMAGVGLDPVSRASRITALNDHNVIYDLWSDIRFSESDGSAILFNHCTNRTRKLEEVTDVVWCVNPLPQRHTQSNSIFTIGDAEWPRGLEITTKEAFDLAFTLHTRSKRTTDHD